MLDEVVLLVLQNATHEVIVQIRLVLLCDFFKMLPLFPSQDFEFVETQVIDAEVLKILRVVCMGHQHHRQDVLLVHERLDVP